MVGTKALGKYRLLRPLGRGSNAEVFLAEPVRYPGHTVVVKRVHDHIVKHPRFRQLFDAEVRSMRNFQHPFAVRLIEADADDPLGPCLVMEYVPGVTLEDLLARTGRLDPLRAGRLLGCFCHALQAAHAAGIVHRDLKPANLMVVDAGTETEHLKVMDFGFAGFAAKPHIQLAELTGHGPIFAIGTPAYVSPEMIRGDTVDGRSDLYSVGVILFEMLSGRLPFDQDTQDELLAAHVKAPPPRFHRIGCGDVSPAVEGVVQLALSKYPNERHQSAFELADGYGAAVGENVWEATTPAGYEPPETATVIHPTPRPRAAPHLPTDPFHVSHTFDVMMGEKMAAAKLKGFVDDLGGDVVASDPGLVRLRLGAPAPTGSGLFGWLRKPAVKAGQEPVEVDLHLVKPDPGVPRLRVTVDCRPLREFPPRDVQLWRTRCDRLQVMLRQYLGA